MVSRDGKLYSIDNRRLLAFNTANVDKVPVEVVSLDDTAISKMFDRRFDPIGGEGNYIAVATREQRVMTQELLQQYNLIKGIQLDN